MPESCKAAALQAARLAAAETRRGQLLRSEGQKLSRKWNRQKKNTKGKKETQHSLTAVSRFQLAKTSINSKQETALIRVLLPQRTAQVRLIILTTIDNRNRAETSGCNSPHLNLQCDKNKLPIKSMSSACSMYKRSVETLWPKSTAAKKKRRESSRHYRYQLHSRHLPV